MVRIALNQNSANTMRETRDDSEVRLTIERHSNVKPFLS
jgi:hypothetical protein